MRHVRRAGACGKAALFASLLVFAGFLLPASRAVAMNIQVVKSPGGITAWLVEEHSVPLIGMRFAFEGGSAQDPAGKDGVAHFLAGCWTKARVISTARPSRSAWKRSPCA